ncbi:MFS transporter [Streptomyces lasalocidi]
MPLVQGREQGWPTWTWECLIAAVPLLAAFWWTQRRKAARDRSPLVHPSLFEDRAFGVGVVSLLVFFAAMASFFLVLALYLQEGRGLSALRSGLLFIPLGLGFFIGSAQSPKVAAKLGKQVLTIGALIQAVGNVALAVTAWELDGSGSVAWCIPAMVISGFGMGFVIAPLASLVLEGVAPHHAAAASGVFSTAQEMGNAIGIAVIGVVFFGVVGHGTGAHPTPTPSARACSCRPVSAPWWLPWSSCCRAGRRPPEPWRTTPATPDGHAEHDSACPSAVHQNPVRPLRQHG